MISGQLFESLPNNVINLVSTNKEKKEFAVPILRKEVRKITDNIEDSKIFSKRIVKNAEIIDQIYNLIYPET